MPCTRYQYDGIQFTIYNCSIQLIPTQPSMQTQPLSVPCPHVRPNIIPHIASSASPVSQRQQYIQQKVIAGKRTFTSLPPPCDPVSTTLEASVSEHLARALQSLGTGKSLSPQIFPKSSSGRPKNVSTGHLLSSGLPSILPICSLPAKPLQDRAQCPLFCAPRASLGLKTMIVGFTLLL